MWKIDEFPCLYKGKDKMPMEVPIWAPVRSFTTLFQLRRTLKRLLFQCLFLFLVQNAYGQTQTDSTWINTDSVLLLKRTTFIRSHYRTLNQGRYLRLNLDNGIQICGKLIEVRNDSVFLNNQGRIETTNVDQINKIWQKSRLGWRILGRGLQVAGAPFVLAGGYVAGLYVFGNYQPIVLALAAVVISYGMLPIALGERLQGQSFKVSEKREILKAHWVITDDKPN